MPTPKPDFDAGVLALLTAQLGATEAQRVVANNFRSDTPGPDRAAYVQAACAVVRMSLAMPPEVHEAEEVPMHDYAPSPPTDMSGWLYIAR